MTSSLEYIPGFRDTLGWSIREDQPLAAQRHLRFIGVGVRTMEALVPGLHGTLTRLLTVDPEVRGAVELLDAGLVAELTRVSRTSAEAEGRNTRILELAAHRHELWLGLEEAAATGRTEAISAIRDLFSILQNRHGAHARRRAEQVNIEPHIDRVVSPEQLRGWLRSFFGLTGAAAPAPESLTVVAGDDRAAFDSSRGHVYLTSESDAATLFHELGHALELDNFKVMLAAESWRDARAEVAQRNAGPVALRELCPGAQYAPDEVALPDHFISPYVGKVYEVFGSEVVSMGIEHFSSAEALGQLFEQDPEHFFFVLGLLEEGRR